MTYLVEDYVQLRDRGLGFGQSTTKGVNIPDISFLNIWGKLIEIGDMLKEEVKRSYDDIYKDKFDLGTSLLRKLSINLIELPLVHPKLIYWDQLNIIYIDKFQGKVKLLRFMGAK